MIKHLRVTVNGKSYDVTVEELSQAALVQGAAAPSLSAPATGAAPPPAPAPVSVAAAAPAAPAAASASAGPASGGPNERTAPLGGTVVEIAVAVGDAVVVDQTVVVLEAMKMKTAIGAHKAGRIAAIYVGVGDGVDVEQPLLSIE